MVGLNHSFTCALVDVTRINQLDEVLVNMIKEEIKHQQLIEGGE